MGQALAASVAPQLGRDQSALSSLRGRLAESRAYGSDSSMPTSVAALVSTIRKFVGPAERGLSELEADIKHGAFTNPGGIASAGAQLARALNPTSIPIKRLKREVAAIIRMQVAELPPVSLAVGPGEPKGRCPNPDDPMDCWILQGDNGAQLSNWLGGANVVASIAGLIAGIGEIPTYGFDTPLTVGADVVGIGTSVAQFYADMVRRAGYGDNVLSKLVTAFMDAASVGTSVFDLGLLGDSLRLKAASEVVEKAAPTVEDVVDALHEVIPAKEDIEKGVELVDLIAKLRDARTALEVKTQAKTIVSAILAVVTEYNGPASAWLNQLAKYLDRHVRPALGSTTPTHHSSEVYFPANAAQGFVPKAGASYRSKLAYLVKPALLSPGCCDAPYGEDLDSWQNWGAASTASSGIMYYDTCTPDCAGGFHHTNGSATLSEIRSCGARREYTEVQFAYADEPTYNATFRLNCAGKITSYKKSASRRFRIGDVPSQLATRAGGSRRERAQATTGAAQRKS